MWKRISVICLIALFWSYPHIGNAWSSGVIEIKKYHYDYNGYTHIFAVRCNFDITKNTDFLIQTKYETKDDKTIKTVAIRIITHKKGYMQPYTPQKAVLTLDNNVWMPIEGDVNIGWDEDDDKSIYRVLSNDHYADFLKRLFLHDAEKIGLTVYATNGKAYRYVFDREQVDEIREVLNK